MQVADQPPVIDLAHDVFNGVERGQLARLVEHGQEDARGELQHQDQQRQRAEEVPDIEVLRRVVAGQLTLNELVNRQTFVQPAQETFALHHSRRRLCRDTRGCRAVLRGSHYAAPLLVVSSSPTTSLVGVGYW